MMQSTHWPSIVYTEEVIREGFGISSVNIPTKDKIELIHALSETGLKRMTLGAFVSPKFVPQMSCFEELLSSFQPKEGVAYLTFLHNEKSRKLAQKYSPPLTIEEEICTFFLDICDVHQRRNVNRSIDEIMSFWPAQIADSLSRGIRQARVAVASAWGSNFLGKFPQSYRLSMLKKQIDLLHAHSIEVVEIGLHDSQSWCLPHEMENDLSEIKRLWPEIKTFHLHMHNARGMALPSIYAALKTLSPNDTLLLDGSLSGVAGGQFCGNGVASAMVATEDFMHMLEGMGVQTNVDINKLIDCAWMLEEILGHPGFGHVSKAGPRPTHRADFYSPNLPAIETLKAARHFKLGPKAYEGETFSPWSKPITSEYLNTK